MSDHHPTLPPSSLDAIAECACYQCGKGGEAADRGTAQHAYLAALLKPTGDNAGTLDAEELKNVNYAMLYIKEAVGSLELLVEEKVTIIDEAFNEVTFGTLDAAAVIKSGLGHFFDYKSGDVHDYFYQMAAYATGYMQRFGLQACVAHLVYGKLRQTEQLRFSYEDAFAAVMDMAARRNDPDRQPKPCSYCNSSVGDFCRAECVLMKLSLQRPVLMV